MKNDPYPDDKVPLKYPSMPDGCVKFYRDEVATATLTCHTAAYIAKAPSRPAQKARANDPESHHVCMTYLVSCTQIQQTNDRDIVGGLAGYTRWATEELKAQQQPGVVLLYSSVSNASIARSTNCINNVKSEKMNLGRVVILEIIKIVGLGAIAMSGETP